VKPNLLHYSLLVSISVHALILWFLMFTPLIKTNRSSQIDVLVLSPQPEMIETKSTSSPRHSRPSVNRNQRGTGRKPAAGSGSSRAVAERVEEAPPESAESAPAVSTVPSGGEEKFVVSAEASGQAGEIAVNQDGAVSLGDGVRSERKGATSARGGPSAAGGSALSGSGKSSTPSELDSFSGAEIPGHVIDAAGHRPPDAGAIYPEVDKYVLYGPDKRSGVNVLGREVCLRQISRSVSS
jgi:hypothetical protein